METDIQFGQQRDAQVLPERDQPGASGCRGGIRCGGIGGVVRGCSKQPLVVQAEQHRHMGKQAVFARTKLVEAIQAEIDLSPPRNPAPADAELPPGFAPYRQHYLNQQRAMQTASGRLRGRLRDMLARQSPAKARLAEVDAVMEATLSPREHSLLAKVPVLLGVHFERLRDAGSDDAWLEVFRRDMQSLLLAELDLRFQPIEGLLAALRTH